ncbi:MAG: LCCL domain-containing protein [Polyangiales bacterium]
MGTETAAPTGIGGGPVATSNTITWNQKLSDFDPKLRQKFTFTCPPNGTLDARVVGTEVYTDDSSICGAAVHAGKITPESGGTVTVQVISGQARYVGSPRNGVDSLSSGSWTQSFEFR